LLVAEKLPPTMATPSALAIWVAVSSARIPAPARSSRATDALRLGYDDAHERDATDTRVWR